MTKTGITPLTPAETAASEAGTAKGEGYIHRNLEEIDVELNVATGGIQDETISSRDARAAVKGNKAAIILAKLLDFFQKNHGAHAVAADEERAKQIIATEEASGVINKK